MENTSYQYILFDSKKLYNSILYGMRFHLVVLPYLFIIKNYYNDAQATFKSLYQQSAELESAKTQEEAPSSIRKETIDQMNTLINYLNMRYADDSSVYGPLTIKIAEMVSSINEKIRTRNTARETANSKTTVNN